MTSPYEPRHVEVKVGERTVAVAEVTPCEQAGEPSGHRLPSSSARLAPATGKGRPGRRLPPVTIPEQVKVPG
jgi:hypothetical protein